VSGLEARLQAVEGVTRYSTVAETWNLVEPGRDFSVTEHRQAVTVMVWRDNRLLAGCIGAPVDCDPGYEWLLDGAYVRLVTPAPAGSRVTIRLLIDDRFINGLNLVFAP